MFSGASLYFLLASLFARYSPFYLYLFLFSFAFLSPYSAFFGVLSNFQRFFLDSLYVFHSLFFFWSLSLFLFILFSPKNPRSTNLNHKNFLLSTNLWLCRYCCFASWLEIENYCSTSTSPVSLSKCGLQVICSRSFTSNCSREALVQCLAMCPQYATLKIDTRVCALHYHLPVFPGAH